MSPEPTGSDDDSHGRLEVLMAVVVGLAVLFVGAAVGVALLLL